MKICIITSSYPINYITDFTSAQFIRDIAKELVKFNNDVHIFTQKKEGEILDDQQLSITRFDWHGRNKNIIFSSLKLKNFKGIRDILSIIINGKKALFNLYKKEKFDVIIALWALPSGVWAFCLKKKYNVPYLTWTLGSDIWNFEKIFIVRKILKVVLSNSDKVYSDGVELAERTSAISSKPCDFLATTRLLPKENLNSVNVLFDNKKINFLFIGRYHPNKAPDILIKAVNILPLHIKEKCHFHIYGGGEMESYIKKLVSNYDLTNITIYGYVNTLECFALMRKAHFLIIPSRKDSIPVTFSDALQSNLPIIASDVGDMKELIEKYKVGFCFKKENINELAALIIKASELNKEVFKENIQELYKIFDIKQVALKLIRDIESIVVKKY